MLDDFPMFNYKGYQLGPGPAIFLKACVETALRKFENTGTLDFMDIAKIMPQELMQWAAHCWTFFWGWWSLLLFLRY